MISSLMFFFFRFEEDRTSLEKNRIAFFVGECDKKQWSECVLQVHYRLKIFHLELSLSTNIVISLTLFVISMLGHQCGFVFISFIRNQIPSRHGLVLSFRSSKKLAKIQKQPPWDSIRSYLRQQNPLRSIQVRIMMLCHILKYTSMIQILVFSTYFWHLQFAMSK